MPNKFYRVGINGSKRNKVLSILYIVVSFCFINLCQAQVVIFDTGLKKYSLEYFENSSYVNCKDVNKIPIPYLTYLNQGVSKKCFANKKEDFNTTDLIDTNLCKRRLILLGQDLIAKNHWFIIYDAGGIAGVERFCDFFEIGTDNKLVSISTIYISNKVSSEKKLKKAIKEGKFYIEKIPNKIR